MRIECVENEKTNTLNVLMGVFFDECASSKHNIKYYGNPSGKSYTAKHVSLEDADDSNYSNVAHLYGAYKHALDGNTIGNYDYIRRVYVSSFSNNVPSDSAILKANVISTVKKACERIYKDLGIVIGHASESFPINRVNLSLDVYGVGLGATAARCFANSLFNRNENIDDEEISLDSYWMDQLGYAFSEDEKISVSLDVRFLGLFDTVSSNRDVENFNDVLDLGLDCGDSSPVLKGAHFCAADEYRPNYSLVTSDSYNENFIQLFFPGTHGDIGGGYKSVVQERLEINQVFNPLRLDGDSQAEFKTVPDSVKEDWGFKSGNSAGSVPYREVVNTYSFVFLFLMLSQTVEDDFDGMIDHNALKVAKRILTDDSFMEDVKKRMDSVVNGKLLYDLNGRNTCGLGNSGLELTSRFVDGDPDGKMVSALRERYLHLPSSIVIDSDTHKLKDRTILKG